MVGARYWATPRVIPFLIAVGFVTFPVFAQYTGGSGTADDPYQIGSAEDIVTLGRTPEDYGKHFMLIADIDLLDLEPNLPGGAVFDRAVIAPDTDSASGYQGTAFGGVFEGNGHIVSHLTIAGEGHLGLFGRLGGEAEVRELKLVDANITGSGARVGILAGWMVGGVIANCYSKGTLLGDQEVGGLIGRLSGTVVNCCTDGSVSGSSDVGGLVGYTHVDSSIINCYSTSSVYGDGISVGGLVGTNGGSVANTYSAGYVSGEGHNRGGLVGDSLGGSVYRSFWDTESSEQPRSSGGTGRTTDEMMDPNMFKASGWDFLGQEDGIRDIWAQPSGGGYPILSWQLPSLVGLPQFSGGTGDPNSPFQIASSDELNSISDNPRLMGAHFILNNDIDLAGVEFVLIGSESLPFSGVFNGNGHTISGFSFVSGGRNHIGLFSCLGWRGEIKNLGLIGMALP